VRSRFKPIFRFPPRSSAVLLGVLAGVSLIVGFAVGAVAQQAVEFRQWHGTAAVTRQPEQVLAGSKYISKTLAQKLASDLATDTTKPLHESLSDREYQVMCQIAAGKSATQIAKELALSVKTISTYRTRILEKMGMKTNAELTRYAIKNDLVD